MKNVYYINLDSREDRKLHVENQLKLLGWDFKRFSAIKHKNSALGCCLSHIALLELAIELDLEYIIIFEDDFVIKDLTKFKHSFNKVINTLKPHFDVLKLGSSSLPPYKNTNEFYTQLTMSFCSHAYMVKKHYFKTLLTNLKQSAFLLENFNIFAFHKINLNCFDVWNNLLIKKDTWLQLLPLTVTQLPGYSNIEKKLVNYDNLCLSLKISDEPFFKNRTLISPKSNITIKEYGIDLSNKIYVALIQHYLINKSLLENNI